MGKNKKGKRDGKLSIRLKGTNLSKNEIRKLVKDFQKKK